MRTGPFLTCEIRPADLLVLLAVPVVSIPVSWNASRMHGLQWFAVACIAIGSGGTLYALWQMRRRQRLYAQAVRVTGTVVKLVRKHSHDEFPSNIDLPTVGYNDKTGTYYERSIRGVQRPHKLREGGRIQLVYERDNPQNVIDRECGWQDLRTLLVMSLLFAAFGLVFLISFVPQL
jgi:hypothetical protein